MQLMFLFFLVEHCYALLLYDLEGYQCVKKYCKKQSLQMSVPLLKRGGRGFLSLSLSLYIYQFLCSARVYSRDVTVLLK